MRRSTTRPTRTVLPNKSTPVGTTSMAAHSRLAAAPAIPAVYFHENDPGSRRDSADKRAEPIGEAGRPTRNSASDAATRATQLGLMVDWLACDSSVRYLPHFFTTFCNVYASDFGYLAGVYLPRVWWTDTALAQISQGHVPAVVYGTTIREMRADDLHAWLIGYGRQFDWRPGADANALQEAANAGGVGVICADRAEPGKPGHITMVVPETDAHRAVRGTDARVTLPLQTQAGATNFRYGTVGRPWWQDAEYRSFVMFVHD